MSLILDALNKADHDRHKNSEQPGDTASPGAPGTHPIPTKLKLGLAATALVLVVVLSAGAFFWGKNHGESTVQVAQAPAQNAAPAARPAGPAASREPPVAPQVKRPPIAKAPAVKKPSPKDQKAIDAQYARASAAKAAAQTKVKPQPREVAALYEQKTEAAQTAAPTPAPRPAPTLMPTPAATPAPTAAPTPTPQPRAEQVPTLADFSEIGSIRSLPWTVQETIPTLTYSAHNFESLQKGSVVINGKQRRRGDTVAKGLVIEMILPDGIILRYNGRAFKVPALNSWVNM